MEKVPSSAFETTERQGAAEALFGQFLSLLGVDLEDENFKETPKRMRKMYEELLYGLSKECDDKINEALSKTFPCTYKGMITIPDIECWGMCPHHFLPVRYEISIAYIPSQDVLGLSKPVRLAGLLAARPVMQEQLTSDIADKLLTGIDGAGVAVVVTGEHSCMRIRGVRASQTKVTTSEVRGLFETDPTTKAEFLKFLDQHRTRG